MTTDEMVQALEEEIDRWSGDRKFAIRKGLERIGITEQDADMAAVGRSLMESLRIYCPDWSPAEDPAEIVTDLLNEIHDLKTAAAAD